MEIAIAVFIGAWIALAAILAFRRLKKDFNETVGKEDKQ